MSAKQALRVMIAGGGTGGHVYPGIAIYRAMKRVGGDVQVLFVGAKAGVEARIFEELGLDHILLSGRGVRKTGLAAQMTSPFLLGAGIARGIREIQAFKPDVVIGTGGYASVAIVAAAVLCRRRRVLQEQNSVPGMANRVLSRFADLVLLSYDESRSFFSRSTPCAVVGNPLRVEPRAKPDEAYEYFQFKPTLQTVLVFGGSRGARAINNAAMAAIKSILARREVQFVVLTGENDFETVSTKLERHSAYVRVYPFLEAIGHAYSIADIAVSRAGASAVFELAAFGIPSIFVPYPHAADDHQRKNVTSLEKRAAAVIVDNDRLDGDTLDTMILTLLDDGPRRREMSQRLLEWSPKDADVAAARKILSVVDGGQLRLHVANRIPLEC